MIRYVLLILGFMAIICQHYIVPIPAPLQAYLFFTGIILLGIPHGAADLLVAGSNAGASEKKFSKLRFLIAYISLLTAFAAVLYFFPLAGNLLFILFAAYHFGETDLYQFKTNSVLGKLFVTSYGLVILSVILLNHFEEVKPLFLQFEAGKNNLQFISWIDEHRYMLMPFFGLAFFASTFIYLLNNRTLGSLGKGQFLVRFACLLFILFSMPMLIGFTFYFIAWHSILSLKNIVGYLRKDKQCSPLSITKQILLYSGLAMAGIALFGLTGFMFVSNGAAMSYLFLGLAVLTAPHMLVMHDMYNHIRINKMAT